MPEAPYARFLPPVLEWIQRTLDAHAQHKRTAGSFRFPRLSLYFGPRLVDAIYVVVTDNPPVPPLSAFGPSGFEWIETQPRAVTYLDTYFIESSAANSESLHFHELVHAVQWRALGAENFLLMYAAGVAKHGYRDSPLEVMAYEHQERFDAEVPPYSAEAEVVAETLALLRR